MPVRLSKSRYLDGLQCPKLLWTRYHDPDAFEEPDDSQQQIFAVGHRVSELAREMFPQGIAIDYAPALVEIAQDTEDALRRRLPVFEAGFMTGTSHCRVDLLVPSETPPSGEAWDLIEVKAGARVKDVHIQDVAFQYCTLLDAGLTVNRLYVMHVDPQYVRGAAFDVRQFFRREDVTERVLAVAPYVRQTVARMLETLAGPDPDTPIGPRCDTPYTCPLKVSCWSVLPPDSVADLYYAGRRAFELMDEGIFTIETAPLERLTPQQAVQQRALRSGRPQVEERPLREWLERLRHPLYFLDFETLSAAIPPFTGARPYQQIPFQFSLHVQARPGAEVKHVEFLATDPGDPRPALIQALRAVGPTGTVLAWNTGFEKGVLAALGEAFPAAGPVLHALAERMVDLIEPFRNFWVYHPEQHGSCSLKAVLPALTDHRYEKMEISDGQTAAARYEDAVYGDSSAEERGRVFDDLLAYCQLDTLAMVEILQKLQGLVG